MKSVLISIQPTWCYLIAHGEKTVEVRKTKPILQTPFKVYIYCTKGFEPNVKYSFKTWAGSGKVIGEFVCDKIVEFQNEPYDPGFDETANLACIDEMQMYEYLGSKRTGYGWHISDLKIYDKQKELSQFWKHSADGKRPCEKSKDCEHEYYDYSENCRACGIDFSGDNCPYMKLSKPPQSWCYVEEVHK